jgi:hypothetical protein
MWTTWGKLPRSSPLPQVNGINSTIEAVHNYSFELCGVARPRVSRAPVRFALVMAM